MVQVYVDSETRRQINAMAALLNKKQPEVVKAAINEAYWKVIAQKNEEKKTNETA